MPFINYDGFQLGHIPFGNIVNFIFLHNSCVIFSILSFRDSYLFWFSLQTTGEKVWRQLDKNAASNIEQVLEATPHKAAAVRPPTTNLENYPS